MYERDKQLKPVLYGPPDEAEITTTNLITWLPMGCPNLDTSLAIPRTDIYTAELELAFSALLQSGVGYDICELCGGEGRAT